jgi:uncharacterized protein YxjI
MSPKDRKRSDGPASGVRYRMHKEVLSIGDDYWVEDESGRRIFKVDGKAISALDTFVLEDASGREIAKIHECLMSVRDAMKVEMDSGNATVHKAFIDGHHHYKIDIDGGSDMSAYGNLADHEYVIESDGDSIATVSKRWFDERNSFGVEMSPDQDAALILAISVCIGTMARG